MTFIELVREYFPRMSQKNADIMLWEFTAFPFADEKVLQRQLARFKRGYARKVRLGEVKNPRYSWVVDDAQRGTERVKYAADQ